MYGINFYFNIIYNNIFFFPSPFGLSSRGGEYLCDTPCTINFMPTNLIKFEVVSVTTITLCSSLFKMA